MYSITLSWVSIQSKFILLFCTKEVVLAGSEDLISRLLSDPGRRAGPFSGPHSVTFNFVRTKSLGRQGCMPAWTLSPLLYTTLWVPITQKSQSTQSYLLEPLQAISWTPVGPKSNRRITFARVWTQLGSAGWRVHTSACGAPHSVGCTCGCEIGTSYD